MSNFTDAMQLLQTAMQGFGNSVVGAIDINEVTANLIANGWVKIPAIFNGTKLNLILQFGLASISGAGDVVNFPIQFPNACLRVLSTDAGSGCNVTSAVPLNKSSFTAYGKANGGTYASTSYQYLAVGF